MLAGYIADAQMTCDLVRETLNFLNLIGIWCYVRAPITADMSIYLKTS